MADLREMGNMKSFGLSGREGLVCFEGQARRPQDRSWSTGKTRREYGYVLCGGDFGTALEKNFVGEHMGRWKNSDRDSSFLITNLLCDKMNRTRRRVKCCEITKLPHVGLKLSTERISLKFTIAILMYSWFCNPVYWHGFVSEKGCNVFTFVSAMNPTPLIHSPFPFRYRIRLDDAKIIAGDQLLHFHLRRRCTAC